MVVSRTEVIMRTSLFAAPIALAPALSPLGCAEDEEPELLAEPGVQYPSEQGNYYFQIEPETEWPGFVQEDRPFGIYVNIGPEPLPPGDPGDVTVDFMPPAAWPSLEYADTPPQVTPDPDGGKFLLNYTFTLPGYYMQEVTITDADGNKDTCVWFYKIANRPS